MNPSELVKTLQEHKIWGISLAANMLTIQLGDKVEVESKLQGTKTVGLYGLHIQSRWRILQNNDQILCSDDVSYADEVRFDAYIKDLQKAFGAEPRTAELLLINRADLIINVDGDLTIESFESTDSSDTADEPDEAWRVLENFAYNIHHVVLADGEIEY